MMASAMLEVPRNMDTTNRGYFERQNESEDSLSQSRDNDDSSTNDSTITEDTDNEFILIEVLYYTTI